MPSKRLTKTLKKVLFVLKVIPGSWKNKVMQTKNQQTSKRRDRVAFLADRLLSLK